MAHLGDPYTVPWDWRGENGAPRRTVHSTTPSFFCWLGGGMTIIAAAKLHTLVQVHDRPKGFFDCESFAWRRSTSLSGFFLFFLFFLLQQKVWHKIWLLPQDLMAAFLFVCGHSNNQDVPPVSKDLWGRWEGEINTIRSGRGNILLLWKRQKSMLLPKNTMTTTKNTTLKLACATLKPIIWWL